MARARASHFNKYLTHTDYIYTSAPMPPELGVARVLHRQGYRHRADKCAPRAGEPAVGSTVERAAPPGRWADRSALRERRLPISSDGDVAD